MSARDEAISRISYYFGRGEVEAAVDYLLDVATDAAAERMTAKAAAMTPEHAAWRERNALFQRLRHNAQDLDPAYLLEALRFCAEHLQGATQLQLIKNLKNLGPAGQEGPNNE